MKQLRKKEIKKLFKGDRRSQEIIIILENVEYARNVAGIFRTADAAAVKKIFLTGISHNPPFGKDLSKASRNKEKVVRWKSAGKSVDVIDELKLEGFYVIAVELTDTSKDIDLLPEILNGREKVCFIFGSEVFGIMKATLEKCDESVFIPMYGKGASLNVGTSVGIVLYSF